MSSCPSSFFFLYWLLISEVTERISTKFVNVFTYDCYLKNLVRTPGHLQFTGLNPPPASQIWLTLDFCPETANNGWRVFAHPLHFRIGRHCQPYRMNFGTCYVVAQTYSLGNNIIRAGSRWACHASTVVIFFTARRYASMVFAGIDVLFWWHASFNIVRVWLQNAYSRPKMVFGDLTS